MILDGRHYVTLREGRGRKFLVVRTNATASPRGRHVQLSYTTVSKHWTFKAATKAAHRLNAQGGIAH